MTQRQKYQKFFFTFRWQVIFFTFITFLFLFLRLYQLSSVPAGLHVDEVSFGYNAYSLMQTGRDEYGAFLPIVLRSFDDYRTALLSYTMIPAIKIFGLSILSIRLTTVFLSFVTYLTFFFFIKIFLEYHGKMQRKTAILISLFGLLLFCISPWNVYLSRVAIDTNLSLFLFLLGVTLLFSFFQKKIAWKIYGSVFSFVLTLYAYNGIKLFLPFFLVLTSIIFWKEFLLSKKHIIIAFAFSIVLLVPLVQVSQNTASLNRFAYLDFFHQQQTHLLTQSSQRLLFDTVHHDRVGQIVDNRRIIWIPGYVTNFLANINPTWLYSDDGINVKYKTPGFGLFYPFEFFLLLFGSYYIFAKKLFSPKILFFFLGWIMCAIFPASLTIDTPSAVRIYPLLLLLLFIEALGIWQLILFFKNRKLILQITFCVVCFSIVVVSVTWFFHAYITTFPQVSSEQYQYGIQQAFQYAKQQKNYEKIFVSNKGNLTDSYIYYLFFSFYNPSLYQKQGGTKSGSLSANHVIGNYVFLDPALYIKEEGKLNQNFLQSIDKHTLYIFDVNDLPPLQYQKEFFTHVHIIKTLSFLDGEPAIVILNAK